MLKLTQKMLDESVWNKYVEYKTELSPGMIVKDKNNKLYIVGNINIVGGFCDDCNQNHHIKEYTTLFEVDFKTESTY